MAAIVLIILALPAIWQLVIPGHFQPHDLHHLADIYEMYRSFLSGQLPPRWAPDFTHGFGYPLFNFYYILPFYLGAFFYAILGSLTESLKLVFLSIFAVSLWGMYRFLREFTDKWASIAGAIIFTYTPYRAVQIYVRGAIGEAMALALFPVASYFLVKLVKEPTSKNTAYASIALALFVSSHNYMWFLSLPFIYLLLLAFIAFKKKKDAVQSIKALVVSGALGIGSVAFWVFPAVLELKHIPRLTPFLLEDHFPFIKQLLFSEWGYGSSVWGPGDELSFQIGLTNLAAVAVLAVLFLFKFRKLEKTRLTLVVWLGASFVVTILFMNIRTLPLWKLLPIYNFVQFPWRLLYLTAFFSSIAGALAVDMLPKKQSKILAILFIFFSIFLNFNYFKPSSRFYTSDQEYFNLFFNDPNYSEDYLLLTEWTEERPVDPPSTKFEIENGQISNVEEITPVKWTANVSAQEDTLVTFNSYYFPGWYAKIDGVQAEITPGDPFGQIIIQVPAGEHSLKVYWAETTLRFVMDIISLTSVAIIILLLRRERSTLRDRIEHGSSS